jgi:hypothetical protein
MSDRETSSFQTKEPHPLASRWERPNSHFSKRAQKVFASPLFSFFSGDRPSLRLPERRQVSTKSLVQVLLDFFKSRQHSFYILLKNLINLSYFFLIYRYLIPSFNLRIDALFCVNFEAGEVFWILILEICCYEAFLMKIYWHCNYIASSSGLDIGGCILDCRL